MTLTPQRTCGPVIHDRDGSVFVVGATGTPRRGEFAGPRPTVVQVTRR